MFERFTERSRRVLVLAQEEARLLNHDHIGTEHILLGLLHEDEGIAGRVLTDLGVSLSGARDRVLARIGRGAREPSGHVPFTPHAKKVLELALVEAIGLKQPYIGTEHILLGLIREGRGAGAQILVQLGPPLPAVRQKVAELAGTDPPAEGDPAASFAAAAGPKMTFAGMRRPQAVSLGDVHERLASIDRRLAAIERHLGIGDADADASGGEAGEETAG